jgi:hypothetical protein
VTVYIVFPAFTSRPTSLLANLYFGILLHMLYTIYFHCSVLGATIYTPLSFTTCFGRTQPSSGNDVSLDRHTVLVLLGSIKVSVF